MSRDALRARFDEADELIRTAIQWNRGIGIDAGTPYATAIAESNRLLRAALMKLSGDVELETTPAPPPASRSRRFAGADYRPAKKSERQTS